MCDTVRGSIPVLHLLLGSPASCALMPSATCRVQASSTVRLRTRNRVFSEAFCLPNTSSSSSASYQILLVPTLAIMILLDDNGNLGFLAEGWRRSCFGSERATRCDTDEFDGSGMKTPVRTCSDETWTDRQYSSTVCQLRLHNKRSTNYQSSLQNIV